MEKVKLTKSQAEEIELIKRTGHPVYWKEDGWLIERSENLVGLSFQAYMNAIYKGYKVEPEYKKGDWIVHIPMSQTRVISSLTKDKYGTYASFDNDMIQGVSAEYIRHATPQEIAKEKERRWWKRHGRKPWELKEGDLLMSLDDVHEVENPTSYGVWFKGFTSGLAYRVIKENYKVVCFKEDRKDA